MKQDDPKLDVLVIAAHPDDAELGCGGTILRMKAQGKKVGIADLTRGELGSRGTAEIRDAEAAAAAKILDLDARVNIGLRDGFFENVESQQLAVIEVIRRFRPEVLLINAPKDRHPDHGRGSRLARDAAFYSGLRRIETSYNGQSQEAWRPKKTWTYIQDLLLMPDFVVDISDYMETKMQAIKAYGSQFFNPDSDEPETYISSMGFLNQVQARATEMGHLIAVSHGEGFISEKPLRVDDLTAHL